MIRPHTDDYRPPRDRRSTFARWLLLVIGAGVMMAGIVVLLIRAVIWAFR